MPRRRVPPTRTGGRTMISGESTERFHIVRDVA
jgi:hypothetical protein